jgi:hypothetical protein
MSATPSRTTNQVRIIPNRLVIALFFVLLSMTGCELFDAGKLLQTVDRVEQMTNRIDTTAAKLAGGLVQGMRDSLTTERTKKELDSLVSLLSSTAVRSMLDTLSSPRSRAELDSLLGSLLSVARDTLTSPKTTAGINKLVNAIGHTFQSRVNSIRDSLLGDGTSRKLQTMINELLGPATRTALDTIIAHGIKDFARGYQNDIHPLVNQEGTTISKQASRLLWTGGGIIALLLILSGWLFVWNKRHKKIAEVLTLQIDRIGDEKVYDDLVKEIKNRAQELNLEPHLRRMLMRQGINK